MDYTEELCLYQETKMTERFDIVVAGAGHNSLVAAAYLAKAGLSCLVLEARQQIGGGKSSGGLTPPRLPPHSSLPPPHPIHARPVPAQVRPGGHWPYVPLPPPRVRLA